MSQIERIRRSILRTMSKGSSPSTDRTTPTKIDTRIKRPSTASGEPPKIWTTVLPMQTLDMIGQRPEKKYGANNHEECANPNRSCMIAPACERRGFRNADVNDERIIR